MANGNGKERIAELNRKIREEERREILGCSHNDPRNGKWLTPIEESEKFKSSGMFKLNDYPNGTVICEGPNGCGAIFNSTVHSKAEVKDSQFILNDIVQQIKVMANMEPAVAEDVRACEIFITEKLPLLCQFYNRMVDKMANMNKNNNKNNGPSKGGTGMPNFYSR